MEFMFFSWHSGKEKHQRHVTFCPYTAQMDSAGKLEISMTPAQRGSRSAQSSCFMISTNYIFLKQKQLNEIL